LKKPWLGHLGWLLVLASAVGAPAALADPLGAVQLLRISGCGGILPAIAPLRHNAQLDQAAALWAGGRPPATAAVATGYPARAAVGLRLAGPDDAILRALRYRRCRPVSDASLQDVGHYRSGGQTWVVMATRDSGNVPQAAPRSATSWTTLHPARAPVPPGPSANAAQVPDADLPAHAYGYAAAPGAAHDASQAASILRLVNAVRDRGTRCGERAFGPAPPLQRSLVLDGVAADHAADMAHHDYFEHVDLQGNTPADRVRASGYREKLVGENIAYGPTSAEEVVAGWLHSTGHCENIMDPRFVEMGLAQARGQGSRRGLYWDQLLAEPAQ
jgi:uncharacterized protein YkwD